MLSSTQSFLWRRPRTVSESSTYWRRIAWWQIVPCSWLDYCVLSCRQRYRWRGQRWRRKWRYKSSRGLGRAVITFSWFPVSFLLASSPPLTHHTQMNQCHHCKLLQISYVYKYNYYDNYDKWREQDTSLCEHTWLAVMRLRSVDRRTSQRFSWALFLLTETTFHCWTRGVACSRWLYHNYEFCIHWFWRWSSPAVVQVRPWLRTYVPSWVRTYLAGYVARAQPPRMRNAIMFRDQGDMAI